MVVAGTALLSQPPKSSSALTSGAGIEGILAVLAGPELHPPKSNEVVGGAFWACVGAVVDAGVAAAVLDDAQTLSEPHGSMLTMLAVLVPIALLELVWDGGCGAGAGLDADKLNGDEEG